MVVIRILLLKALFSKAEIDVEKGLKCKEKVDPIKKKGVGNKECEGGMKKTISIGIRTNELVEDILLLK